MSDISEYKTDVIINALEDLGGALSEEGYIVTPKQILIYLEGQLIDEEDAGTIRRQLEDA
ncbi:MAG: hypothetical protein KAJ55_03100 [Anaerolineales bacterium]|nr:hypothetical protein [Anaerolineales bacterium]MCK5603550.1 hypothetical protein [Candidatus Pacearchaeota archaeon]